MLHVTLSVHLSLLRPVRAAVDRSRAWLTELSLSESASLGYVGLQAYSLLPSFICLHRRPQSSRAAW